MQIVGYDSGVGHLRSDPVGGVEGEVEPPALLIAEGGTVRRERLPPGHELAYTLGERRCAGTHDGETHDPCGADGVPRCEAHTSVWPCARCTGDCEKPIDACDQEHAVYLAAFAPDHVKVGVTRSWRLHARLREQGADRAAHLRTVSDGRIARRIEREMARDLTDRVGIDVKIRALGRSVDEVTWRDHISAHEPLDTYDFDYGLDLDERPVAETLATGTVVGSQGRLLVLERAGSTYAVDLRDLVGHDIEPGSTGRDLQASLGAFEG
ncbi:MAG: DUF2797 domain-containing protein [Halobacteriales archaeon]